MNIQNLNNILSFFNKKELEFIKNEISKNQLSKQEIIQRIFNYYLRNNKFEYNKEKEPRLYIGDNIEYFTNGVSLYQINSNIFKNNNNFKLTNKSMFLTYFDYLSEKYGKIYSCLDKFYTDKNYLYVDYKDAINHSKIIKRFDADEIEVANIVLENPIYKISNSYPILYAENDIGKVYILGYKNTFKE